jgi:hypothetical protein
VRLSPAIQRERRQFRLLVRHSLRRLLDRVVASRDADPMQFALWAVVLASMPPLLLGVRKLMQFAFIQAVSAADPGLSVHMLTAERVFFVVYGMLVSALLAALTWEALYPDRLDQEVVGVLPVRPRTLAAARLAASLAVAATVAAVINIPAGVIYGIGSLAHPVGSLPRVLVGHVTSTMLACAFVFLAMLALRGVVAICAGERVASRLSIVLQFVTVVVLIDMFLFLPYVVLTIVRTLQADTGSMAPPVWFAALYFWLAEGNQPYQADARVAATVTGMAAAAAALVSLAPAAWMGRRALHIRSRARASALMPVTAAIARVFARRPAVRGMFLFGAASLTRSRRHMLVLARYFGLAIAAAILSVLAPVLRGTFQVAEPRSYLLAIPLLFIFFAVVGLRGAIALPTDLEANWPFRLATPTADAAVRASRLLIVSFGIAPLVAAWLLLTLTLWPPDMALRIAVLDLAAGLLVMEISLLRWTKIPFATAHEPATDTLKSRWAGYLLFLLIFAKGGAALQFAIVQSTAVTARAAALMTIAIVVVRLARGRHADRVSPAFDPPPDAIQALNLSEAAN